MYRPEITLQVGAPGSIKQKFPEKDIERGIYIGYLVTIYELGLNPKKP